MGVEIGAMQPVHSQICTVCYEIVCSRVRNHSSVACSEVKSKFVKGSPRARQGITAIPFRKNGNY